MPELPEAEVVRRGVEHVLLGGEFTCVDVRDERELRRFAGTTTDFVEQLTGAQARAVVRRGKFLWAPLQRDGRTTHALVVHLGMSGQLLRADPTAAPLRHERVRFTLRRPEGGDAGLAFVDQRVFGYVGIEPLVATVDGGLGGYAGGADWGEAVIPAHARHIARDPLDPQFDEAAFLHAVRRSRSGIKRILLDQGRISGIGNIYADEALWRARIHPETRGTRMAAATVTRLLSSVRDTLQDALAAGGTSFDEQYKRVNGESGYFQRDLAVYGRAGEPCRRCGTPIRRESFMNRSSHWCPRCQHRH